MNSVRQALLISLTCLSAGFFSLSKTNDFTSSENINAAFHALFDMPLYFGAGTILGSASLIGGITWSATQLFPKTTPFGEECHLLSRILGIASLNSFTYALKRIPLLSLFLNRIPSSSSAWEENKNLLAQVPMNTKEDEELIHFLQKRWLAKTTGCYRFLVDWGLPLFGISHQVHPESTNSYARNPANKLSKTYIKRVDAWKHLLPHPSHFPLLLTRLCAIHDYLPNCISIHPEENIECFFERLDSLMQSSPPFAVIDATSWFVLKDHSKEWLEVWEQGEKQLFDQCAIHKLDPNKIICIQRQDLNLHTGVRLLPFSCSSKEVQTKQLEHLLDWVSKFGLSSNRVELDRTIADAPISFTLLESCISVSKHQYHALFDSLETSWRSSHPQKTILFQGTMKVLKDLFSAISDEKWQEISSSTTRSSVVELALKKIEHKLRILIEEDERLSFHDAAEHLEQVHADLTSFIEIFSLFTPQDFSKIFKAHLTCIPEALRPLSTYGIHSSGMTNMGGIFRAVEKFIGRKPHILHGENTYFECLYASEVFGKPIFTLEATEQDFKEADLILAQFNPAIKRVHITSEDFHRAEYHVEKIGDVLQKALSLRDGKPLTIAIDCTFDYSDSSRVNALLQEFQKEIQSGALNIICYRSGIKYDLFGMDNYCGAPFYMIHNEDPGWAHFDSLLTDPTLQTDRLSLNWFCLAFQQAAPFLEAYRKQIFDNTHAVLERMPQTLTSTENRKYRVIPMESDTDPTFIDIKIFGPMHELRGSVLVGGILTIKSLQAGLPLLFRPGIGFFHPNISVIMGEVCTTVRLSLGLDPAQIDVFVTCLKYIDVLNGPT
jgi:hypothetical protein